MKRVSLIVCCVVLVYVMLGCQLVLERQQPMPKEPGTTEICLWKGNKQAATSITFDDALLTCTQTYVQLLNDRDMCATFYVPTDWIDNPNAEIKDYAGPTCGYPAITLKGDDAEVWFKNIEILVPQK